MPQADKNDATILLRLPADLKAMLMREAAANGRRITAEVNIRLKESLERTGVQPSSVPGWIPKNYRERSKATVAHTEEPGAESELTDMDRAVLAVFRRLSPEKQLALLSLFK
jgi:hypothetical protein